MPESSKTAAAILVGNPKAGSRTLQVANAVLDAAAEAIGLHVSRIVVDLAEHVAGIFDPSDAALADCAALLSSVDLLVVASPTYKASFTGLLKAFLDRYGPAGLAGVVTVPVMVGASAVHALAPEVFLRPVLVELGATLPTRGVYVLESQVEHLDDVLAGWAGTAAPALASALGVVRAG